MWTNKYDPVMTCQPLGALVFLSNSVSDQRYAIADPDDPGTVDIGVECESAVESLNDVAEYAGINLQGIGIDGRHVTTSAQRVQPDDRIADMQTRARPLPFSQSIDARDEDVRAKAAHITSEGSDRAVGGDKKREDIEAIQAIPRFEPRIGACGVFDERKRFGAVPGVTVNAWTAVDIERAAQAKEPILPAGRTHAFRSTHPHDAIARNSVWSQYRHGYRFSSQ
jgi:hypothetical protein